VATFEDAAHDATGPGSYAPPGDSDFVEGDFDLRRFAVYLDGEDVLFEVTLGAPIRPPAMNVRGGSTPIPLQNGIFLQNVDIYLDTDRSPGAGSSECIPGRRVAFAGGRTWEAAVVLTPQPGLARSVIQEVLGRAADRVVVAERLVVRGRTVTARVPAALLGGLPRADWGYSVHLSGARWEASYDVTRRLRGRHTPDAFTMPVLTTPEAWAFGGGPLGEVHPYVVDVLLPPWLDQRAVLGSFDAAAGTFARVPFLTAGEPAPPPAPAASAVNAASTPAAPSPGPTAGAGTPLPPSLAPSLSALPAPAPAAPVAAASGPKAEGSGEPAPILVVDVTDDLVSASGPVAGLRPMQFGRVVDASGFTLARVMIVRVLEKGLVATAVANGDRIKPGGRLVFEAPGRPKPGPPPTP
jgi:hypothetical protein